MTKRTILASFAIFVASLAAVLAADPNMGTWKLNLQKSNFSPGATKNMTVTYAAAGDMVTVTVDGVDRNGKAVHSVWKGRFDGKDYKATGESAYDTRAYTRRDARTTEMTVRKAGKLVASGYIILSADGKSRVVTTTGADPKNAALNNTAVYDKQ